MTTESKKPSDVIREARMQHAPADLPAQQDQALWTLATIAYLDVEHERRAAFEKDVLERLAKVERKTSSTDDVVIDTFTIGEPHTGNTLVVRWAESADPRGDRPNQATAEDGIFAALMSADAPVALSAACFTHVAARDSLTRYGTGHPGEMPCAHCGRPSWDKQTALTVDGKRFCCAACKQESEKRDA